MQDEVAAERDVAEQLVGAVGAERVHEAAGADVAVGAGERMAVEVAGAAGEGEGAVDDPRASASLTKVFAACVSANSATASWS